jgi:hypothetical protein
LFDPFQLFGVLRQVKTEREDDITSKNRLLSVGSDCGSRFFLADKGRDDEVDTDAKPVAMTQLPTGWTQGKAAPSVQYRHKGCACIGRSNKMYDEVEPWIA